MVAVIRGTAASSFQKGKKGGPYEALKHVREVKVVDAGTVQLLLTQPYDLMPWLTLTFMASPAAMKTNEKDGDLAADWHPTRWPPSRRTPRCA